jgi:hypothetical protein
MAKLNCLNIFFIKVRASSGSGYYRQTSNSGFGSGSRTLEERTQSNELIGKMKNMYTKEEKRMAERRMEE